MDRQEALLELVADVITADYEDIDIIISDVTKLAAEEGLDISAGEVRVLLRHLVETGRAGVYRLSPTPPHVERLSEYVESPDTYFLLNRSRSTAINNEEAPLKPARDEKRAEKS